MKLSSYPKVFTLAECHEEIKEQLFKWAWKSISRQVTAGFPEFYKDLLAKKQFEETKEHG